MLCFYILILAGAFAVCLSLVHQNNQLSLATISDDSDMKIAPESFNSFLATEEPTDAESFLAHKENGNIDKAHSLGERLFELIKNQKDFHDFPNKAFVDEELKVCLFFIAGLILEENCPDEIISSSANSSLAEGLKQMLPDVYLATTNNAVASVIILKTKDSFNRDVNFGKAFAEICGNEDDDKYISFGVHFFRKYSEEMKRLIQNANFK